MCKHSSSTVVIAETVAIHQCDVCGGLLPLKEVDEDAMPTLLDTEALEMWFRRAGAAIRRDGQRLEMLQANDPTAYRAEVQRLLSL